MERLPGVEVLNSIGASANFPTLEIESFQIVEAFQRHSESKNSTEVYTVYNIEVVYSSSARTNVFRRFSQIWSLHCALYEHFLALNLNVVLPDIPPKAPFTNKNDPHLVSERKERLTQYLNALHKLPQVVECSIWKVFWELYDLSGKVVLVTGGSAGIGKVNAWSFARMRAHVIIAARNRAKSESVISDIKRDTLNEKVDFMELNLASFKSVDAFIQTFISRNLPLHILLNNAGVSGIYERTEDNFDTIMQVNYISLARLTLGLLDVLKRSAPSRIVNVASTFHFNAIGGIPYDQVHDPPDRPLRRMDVMPGGFYPASKLAVVTFSITLAERLKGTGVVVHSVHPGHVATELWEKGQSVINTISNFLFRPVMLTEDEGARTSMFACASEEAATSTGKYWDSCLEKRPAAQARSKHSQDELWKNTEEWLSGSSSSSASVPASSPPADPPQQISTVPPAGSAIAIPQAKSQQPTGEGSALPAPTPSSLVVVDLTK